MSALYSWIKPDDRATVIRRGHRSIRATLATWDGAVDVELEKDGTYRVTVGPHPHGGQGARIVVAQGNVKIDEREAVTSDLA